jgi:hypothetical protein
MAIALENSSGSSEAPRYASKLALLRAQNGGKTTC